MTSLILPWADTAMMTLFLSHVGTTFADSFIVMQVDQAEWHQAKDLSVPENIRLIAQPAYSPKLNPVEHVWDELRENTLPMWPLPLLRRSSTGSVMGSLNEKPIPTGCAP